MKHVYLLCLALALALSTQAQFHLFKSKKQQDTTATSTAPLDSSGAPTGYGVPPKKPMAKKRAKHVILPLQPFYVLSGTVKDTSKVFLWLSIGDSVIRGSARYLSTGDSLPLFGTIEPDGKLVFCGFSPDGNMLGCFTGKIVDDSIFQGRWFALTSDSAWNCNLFRKDTTLPGLDTGLIASRPDGTYSYHLGDAGPAGGIIIHKVGGSSDLSLDIGCAGGPPDYASAMIKGQVPFDGTTSTYTSPNKPFCKLRIRVFKDFVVINYVPKMDKCGYGANVEGVFARTK
jgi:hypothetical protein